MEYMKKLFKINSQKHIARICIALGIALIVNFFAAETKQGWLPCATIIVMLTPTGSALYQGIWRFFLVSSMVALVSLFFSSMHLLSMRMYDVVLGSVIGIIINVMVFPDKVDVEYRNAFIPLLKSYACYFSSLITLLLEQNSVNAEKAKIRVEKNFKKLPVWIYEMGFDLALQTGYRYFFMKVSQIGEILFSMHGLARYPFPKEVLQEIQKPLLQCAIHVEKICAALIIVLELKKLPKGVADFDEELVEIEEKIKNSISSMEIYSAKKEDIYLAEFSYYLRELRQLFIDLSKTLR